MGAMKDNVDLFWQAIKTLSDASDKKDEWVSFSDKKTGLSFKYPSVFKDGRNKRWV